MGKSNTLKTDRLILRPWREEDAEPFAKLNADHRVREYFPSLLTRQESDASLKRMAEDIRKQGWGFWAVSLSKTGEFIGFIGIMEVDFSAHFTPAVEIGWRLSYEYWGKGYATEGAKACLKYAFQTLNLNQVVAFTAEDNLRSQNVMKKIGMHRDSAGDFDHPKIPEGNLRRRQVLYRINKEDWLYH